VGQFVCYVHGIDFDGLTSGPMSSGERALLKWAANLFNPIQGWRLPGGS